MAYRTSNYSDLRLRLAALAGIDSLSTFDASIFNRFFQRAIRKAWRADYWPECCPIEQRTPDSDYFIDYDQAGETAIGEVFNVWDNDPHGSRSPRSISFVTTGSGIKLLGVTTVNPVYVYFRKRVPTFTGSAYSAGFNYAAGTNVAYTSTSTGVLNYYTALSAVGVGQTPDTHPSLWELQVIPYRLAEFVAHSTYADWLRSDGQADKAAQADIQAEDMLLDEGDILQRQERFIPPTQFVSHHTSRL